MKTLKLSVLAFFILVATAANVYSQRGFQNNRGACKFQDLTEEQEAKLSELRTQQLEASTQHRLAMDELRAKKQRLSISENPNMNEINSIIDQMESLRADHLKETEAHKQSVRSVLTPEQRAEFDSRHQLRPRGQGPRFQNRGQGRGPNCRGPRGN
jgi:Spy/CpxP family protein refolding chaperone